MAKAGSVTAGADPSLEAPQHVFTMKLIKTDLRGLNALMLLGRARVVRNQMKNNPLFPAPSPSMPEFEAGIERLAESVRSTYNGASRYEFHLKQRHMEELADMIKSLAAYVSIVANGDSQIVLAAGFELRRASAPINQLEAPKYPRSKSGRHPQTIDLRWEPVHGARMYRVFVRKGYASEGPSVRVVLCTKSRCTVDKLEPLEHYTFQVQALGARAEGPISAITSALSIGIKAA